jgi:hypothetical protein
MHPAGCLCGACLARRQRGLTDMRKLNAADMSAGVQGLRSAVNRVDLDAKVSALVSRTDSTLQRDLIKREAQRFAAERGW